MYMHTFFFSFSFHWHFVIAVRYFAVLISLFDNSFVTNMRRNVLKQKKTKRNEKDRGKKTDQNKEICVFSLHFFFIINLILYHIFAFFFSTITLFVYSVKRKYQKLTIG